MTDKWDQAAEDAVNDDNQVKYSVRFVELEKALLDSKGLRDIPSPVPLIDGYLFRDSLAWIGGKPGHAKSFVAAETACCIGTGRDWFGHKVTKGTVLYLIAEGASGFSDRIETWETHYGIEATNVTFLPLPIQFMKDIDVVALGMLLDKYRYDLVIIDTQARVTVGMKENDSTDMGLFVDRLEELRRLYGACFLLVHHEPRNGEHLRGSIAMEGAAASILRTFKEGNQVTLETTKQKDIEEPDPFDLQLFQTHKSAVLLPLQPGEEALTQTQMHVLKVLQDNPSEWVSKTELKVTCGLADTTFYTNINALIRKGYIEQKGTGAKKLRYIPEQDRLI
jgi:RecA-family ATPase